MSNMQLELHSDNFDYCRLCMLQPELSRRTLFFKIFERYDKLKDLTRPIRNFLGIEVTETDDFPKIICEDCFTYLKNGLKRESNAINNQIIFKYLHQKKFGNGHSNSTHSISIAKSLSRNAMNCSVSTSVLSLSSRSTGVLPSSFPSTNESPLFSPSTSALPLSSPSTNESLLFSPSTNHYSEVHSLEKKLVVSEPITQSNVLPSGSNSQSTSGETSSNYQSIEPVYQNSDSDDTSSVGSSDYANMLINCLLCQKYIKYDHNCCEHNINISTCLVPNCNIVSRTLSELLPHYRYHIAIKFGKELCRVCRRSYQRNTNKICEFNECSSNNIFYADVLKCYVCDIVFKTMIELTSHKLQEHDCVLKDGTGKYICFHCEMVSNDMTAIVAHSNNCFANSLNFEKYIDKKNIQSTTANSSRGKRNNKRVLIPKNTRHTDIVNTKNHMLFTCTQPSCKKIFIAFSTFKKHFRKHFEIENKILICWQCLRQFVTTHNLRKHQGINCRNSDIFTCHECLMKHNDLEALSVHKYIFHDADLIHPKRVKGNFINCKYCKESTNIDNLKKHLIKCSFKLNQI